MKKIQVSYAFSISKFVEINVDDLVDFIDDDEDETLEEIIEKYIYYRENDLVRIDSSDEINDDLLCCDVISTTEEDEDEDDYECLDENFTIEDLIELKSIKYEKMYLYCNTY